MKVAVVQGVNTGSFSGKPIMAYSIEAARDTGLFDRIIVFTDSEETAVIAREYGAESHFMLPASSTERQPLISLLIQQTLGWFTDQGVEVDYLCCLFAIAPFVLPEFIHEGYEA